MNFLLKQMLRMKLGHVPEEQRNKMIALLEKNPELFKKIAEESQELMKQGKDQMSATMEVAKKYQDEIQNMMK